VPAAILAPGLQTEEPLTVSCVCATITDDVTKVGTTGASQQEMVTV